MALSSLTIITQPCIYIYYIYIHIYNNNNNNDKQSLYNIIFVSCTFSHTPLKP